MYIKVDTTKKGKELTIGSVAIPFLTAEALTEKEAIELAYTFINAAKELLPESKAGFRAVLDALG